MVSSVGVNVQVGEKYMKTKRAGPVTLLLFMILVPQLLIADQTHLPEPNDVSADILSTADLPSDDTAVDVKTDDDSAEEIVQADMETEDPNSSDMLADEISEDEMLTDDLPVENGQGDDFFDMSIEQLAQEPFIVVSASRKKQKRTELSVPVTVISAEDVHYSGLAKIEDIVQFAPEVDFIYLNRFTVAIGVRGLHEPISDRLKLLVNGRSADSPVYGGPEFDMLSISTEDIERIEIVRGPGGAVWGANAFTGVVNIITKKPEDVQGTIASTTISEFGDTYSYFRYGGSFEDWYWRFSMAYDDEKSSKDALGSDTSLESFVPSLNTLMGFDSMEIRDFSRRWKFDFQADKKYDDGDVFSFGAGYTNFTTGDFERIYYQSLDDRRKEQTRLFARYDFDEPNGDAYMQWFSNIQNFYNPNTARYTAVENDLEFLNTEKLSDKHEISYGANFRWTHINTGPRADGKEIFQDDPFDEYLAGIFGVHRCKASDKLKFETQVRGDWYSETETDIAARVTALYALDDQSRHVARISGARSFRSPLAAIRKLSFSELPLNPTTDAINVLQPGELDNEEIYSIEAGYTGKLSEQLSVNTDIYYHIYRDLIGYSNRIGSFGEEYYKAANIDGAKAWGSEIEFAYTTETCRLSAWYAYNAFQENQNEQEIRAFQPAKHKAGLGFRLFMQNDFTLNLNYKYQDTTPGNPGLSFDNSVEVYNRVDINLSKKFADGNGEFMIGVNDVFNKKYDPAVETTTVTGYDVPGRMLFVRLQWKF